MTQLYTLRSTAMPGEFIITKFDGDYNPEATYVVSRAACSAPDGHRPKCKHREMLKLFATSSHIDDGWFLDWDTRLWRTALVDVAEMADRLQLDNSKASEPPSLGAEPEDKLASALAPAFASETSNPTLSARPTSALAEPPPPAKVAASSAGGGIKRRKLT